MRKAIVNLKALEHNFWQVKRIAPNSKVIAMVKSNAYGHGLIPVSLALPEAEAFGVACVSEAVKLRQAGIKQPIILMSGFHDAKELPTLDENRLDMVVHHMRQLEVFTQYKFENSPQLWIKVNTGMNRLGFLPEEIEKALETLSQCSYPKPINWLTHFANSDEVQAKSNQQQLELFKQVVKNFPGEKTAANSGAIIAFPEAHFDWVRPGILLYGVSPCAGKIGKEWGVKPVMTLLSKLISVYRLKAGETVGYGSTWSCAENMPMGVISLGYGDGYPRHAGTHGAMVSIGGVLCPLIGRVSMDLMAVDLRPCPQAKADDVVVLWGEEIPIERLASHINTIGYELLCQVSSRVKFQYDCIL